MKSILGIISSPPTGSSKAHEGIEMLMVFAAFGFKVSLVLQNTGVTYLQKSQNPEVIKIKNHASVLPGLELYDIENIYVDEQAFNDYTCNPMENLSFELITDNQMKALVTEYDEVVCF